MDGSGEQWRSEMEDKKEIESMPESTEMGTVRYDDVYFEQLTNPEYKKRRNEVDDKLIEQVNQSLGNQKIEY